MKALKIGGFFLAGAIIQVAFYLLEFLGIFAGYGGLMLVSFITTGLGVFLGCMAHKLAEKKMKMSPVVLTMCYFAGTLAMIAALFISIPPERHISGLGNLPNLGRNISLVVFFFTLPSAAINAIVQIVLCVREKINQNKE
ncbi:MAG: hypothetical protein MR364_06235 [Oscillospiraceae bacterium]|nr:hypothetical protein [Oscillospiraceae bacterium]